MLSNVEVHLVRGNRHCPTMSLLFGTPQKLSVSVTYVDDIQDEIVRLGRDVSEALSVGDQRIGVIFQPRSSIISAQVGNRAFTAWGKKCAEVREITWLVGLGRCLPSAQAHRNPCTRTMERKISRHFPGA